MQMYRIVRFHYVNLIHVEAPNGCNYNKNKLKQKKKNMQLLQAYREWVDSWHLSSMMATNKKQPCAQFSHYASVCDFPLYGHPGTLSVLTP